MAGNLILFRNLLVLTFFLNSTVLAYNYGTLSYYPLSKHKHTLFP